MQVTDPFPVIAVPLRDPTPDVPLDLGDCMNTVYEEAAYDLSIDYSQKPPLPAFDEQTQNWIETLLRAYQPAGDTTAD